MDDSINRQAAIDCVKASPINGWVKEDLIQALETTPSAQPEYFDYTDIDEAWEYYAKEHDANLTDNAKQIKDAMWVGYRIGLKSVQSEPQ